MDPRTNLQIMLDKMAAAYVEWLNQGGVLVHGGVADDIRVELVRYGYSFDTTTTFSSPHARG